MGKIAVLDQQTIDKIAAGEVVERPASVVKELVENAIDAGATQITVEIKEGGIGYIRITDNGSGMEKDDIPVAFLRHSTSKIRSADDLLGVSSLGFRGEALSSISAVAMVELITKTKENELGSRCCIEGGVQKSLEEIGAPDGTTFIIRNLFYNTPARKKFLKSEMSEASAIHELMTHLAMSHPEVGFKVLIGGQMRIQTSGNGNLKDVIYHLYGRDVAMCLIEVDREEGPLHVRGFLGKPEISRGNRNYENYFVNGRYVKSKIIAKGIEDGYKTFMMQHRYPFVCLDIHMDGKMLDVNVHPTKMELRFSNQNLVYDLLERMTKDALSGRELIPEVTLDEPKKQVVMPEKAPQQVPPVQTLREPESTYQVQKPAAIPTASVERTIPSYQKPEQKVPLEKIWTTPEPQKEPVKPQDKNLEYFMEQMRKRVEERYKAPEAPAPTEQRETTETAQSTVPEQSATVPETPVEEKPPQKPEQLDLFDGKLLSKEAAVHHVIIGQLFDTYWLVQFGEKLYIIDQHAAHEKVLYERLMKDLRNRTFQSQMLSPPIILNLSMQEEELFLKYRSCFTEMGFEIEEFGEKAYAVRAVPANLPGVARREILMELLDSLSDITGSGNSESLMDKVASMSCKAAVKGNHQMSAIEAKALIDELLSLENPYNCPHGRPTIISMSKYELEKKFKRIV
ncbi:DNA mismatch repair endonuclease MutL [Clostridiaceae bacterium Marseille-Q4143]|nr:DNA mismatch repair endonuclease MutL [Clostridiaceae bacterium Marseille-Q4143]